MPARFVCVRTMLRSPSVRTLILVSLLLVAGCKAKPNKDPSAGSAGSGLTGSGLTGSGHVGSGDVGSGSEERNIIRLPPSTGTPPNKTTAALVQAQADKMTALEFPGFTKEVRSPTPTGMDVRLKTVARPHLTLAIKASHCVDCKPMQVDAWNKDHLKLELLPDDLRSFDKLTFDVEQTELNGQPMVAVYQLGSRVEKDGGNTDAIYTNAYTLFYNDGINMIRVTSAYKDSPLDRADLEKIAPKQDLERMAKAFLDAYTHAW